MTLRSMFRLSMKEFAILDQYHCTYDELNAEKIEINLKQRIILFNNFMIVCMNFKKYIIDIPRFK